MHQLMRWKSEPVVIVVQKLESVHLTQREFNKNLDWRPEKAFPSRRCVIRPSPRRLEIKLEGQMLGWLFHLFCAHKDKMSEVLPPAATETLKISFIRGRGALPAICSSCLVMQDGHVELPLKP